MKSRNYSDTDLVQVLSKKGRLVAITINQHRHKIEQSTNLQQIITQLSLPEIGCVFAINNNVVPRSEWADTILSEGDSISLFQAIAGG
ncbi:sulfur carrier protein ThiS [Vibrio alginolyticus]|uniref:sulfur carrier protein ThiS n=1 Tax=Vibrio sp. B1FLJ16 TaxID=2751178 RepID=UPI0015F70915|nr:sulfur carrier protein ThiS [Vibrio sp. B1FLJ16]CAD7815198.1 COG2104 Sulfur transfer protein involved in thiamine biosynthesis [Vibrio sp. B1FLJ16]CAE6925970.1 COG2104 Sulfur transfer protein involved in thiamine biosynthesis [Vibrio sp. B1FLJ16]